MKEKISPEIKKLVLFRLEAEIPSGYKLSIGSKGSFTKEELKEHIEKEDDIGRTYIEMQMRFIKAVASGEFTKVLLEE